MAVFAIADLHLSIGNPSKNMDVFGGQWVGHQQKLQKNWKELVEPDDLVLLPGDISWAKQDEEVKLDFAFIDDLPGVKVMIKGNHDYFWGSYNKLKKLLPPSLHAIQNNVFNYKDISVAGARLWDTDEYDFDEIVRMQENPVAGKKEKKEVDDEKIFARELERLRLSLEKLDPAAKHKIVMTHYPPIGWDLKPSSVSQMLEEFEVEICVFGHVHSVFSELPLFGTRGGVRYVFCASDYIKNVPVKILD